MFNTLTRIQFFYSELFLGAYLKNASIVNYSCPIIQDFLTMKLSKQSYLKRITLVNCHIKQHLLSPAKHPLGDTHLAVCQNTMYIAGREFCNRDVWDILQQSIKKCRFVTILKTLFFCFLFSPLYMYLFSKPTQNF